MDKKLATRYVVRETRGVLIMGVALFWSSGELDWWAAWALLAVTTAWVVGTALVIDPADCVGGPHPLRRASWLSPVR